MLFWHKPFVADDVLLCSCSSSDPLSAEDLDGGGEGQACPGVKRLASREITKLFI